MPPRKTPHRSVALCFSLCLVGSCGGPAEISPQHDFSSGIALDATSDPLGPTGHRLLLRPEALKKPFLLRQSSSETASYLGSVKLPFHQQAMIVYFSQGNDTVFLSRSREGTGGPLEDPGNFDHLLATFPILQSFDDGNLLVDFRKGMEEAYGEGALASQIKEISMKGPHLYVIQSFKGGPSSPSSYEIYTTLSPYKENLHFRPLELKDHPNKHIVSQPIERGTGEVHQRVARFDLSRGKKVVFHLSQNIPQDYLQAVKDGALYWNRVFDREVIKLRPLSTDQSFFGPEVNVIQWLQWDKATFAYADLLLHPLTGEILQSSAFITSSFIPEKLPIQGRAPRPPLAEILPPAIMNSHTLCYDEESGEGMLTHPKEVMRAYLKGQKMTKEQEEVALLRYSQDTIRNLVAHEVGHALGFDHNFAASTTTNVAPQELSDIIRQYLLEGDVPEGITLSGSVMDYHSQPVDALIGAQIRLKHEANPYDRRVAQLSYELDIEAPKNLPFCSGQQIGPYVDCKSFDTGDPISSALDSYFKGPEHLSLKLMQKYEFLLEREYQDKQKTTEEMAHDIQDTPLWPRRDAWALAQAHRNLIKIFSQDAQFLSIRALFPKDLTLMDLHDYRAETHAHQQASLPQGGGVADWVLAGIGPSYDAATQGWTEIFPAFMKNIHFYVGALYEGLLPQEARDSIIEQGKEYLHYVEREFLLKRLMDLKDQKLAIWDETFPQRMKEAIFPILFERSEEGLPIFEYTSKAGDKTLDLRLEAIRALMANLYDSHSYNRSMFKIRKEAHEKHLQEMKSLKEQEERDGPLPKDLYDWKKADEARFRPLKNID